VEVKYRSRPPDNVSIGRDIIEKLKRLWPESILVFVLPFDEVFYAIRLDKINISAKSDDILDLPPLKNYLIQYEFPRVTDTILEPFRKLAKNMFKGIDLGAKVITSF
jgi:hypothetical protein